MKREILGSITEGASRSQGEAGWAGPAVALQPEVICSVRGKAAEAEGAAGRSFPLDPIHGEETAANITAMNTDLLQFPNHLHLLFLLG